MGRSEELTEVSVCRSEVSTCRRSTWLELREQRDRLRESLPPKPWLQQGGASRRFLEVPGNSSPAPFASRLGGTGQGLAAL